MKVIAILFLSFVLVACGVFNKSRQRDKTHVKVERKSEVAEQKGVTIQQTDKGIEFTEIVIRMPKDKAPKLDTREKEEYESLHDAVIAAIGNSEETTFRSSRTRESGRTEIDTGKVNEKRSENVDSLRNEIDLQKESDTTWLANFSPWVILSVAAMIILAVFMYFRFRRP